MTVVVGRSDANLLCAHSVNHWCLAVKTDESQRPPDAPHWVTTALMISGIPLLRETYIKGSLRHEHLDHFYYQTLCLF